MWKTGNAERKKCLKMTGGKQDASEQDGILAAAERNLQFPGQ